MVVVPLADAEHVAVLTRHAGSGMAWWLLRRENDDDPTDVATVLAEMVASASNPGQSVWLGRVKGSASALRYAAEVTLANTGGGRWRPAGDAVVVGALGDAEVLSLIDASVTVGLDLELVRTTTDRSAAMLTALGDTAAAPPWGADAVVIRTAGSSYAMVGRPTGSLPIRAAGLRPLSAPEPLPPVRRTPAMPRRATVTLAVGVAVGVLAVAVGLAAEHLGPSRAVARGTPAPGVHALGPQSPRTGPPPSAPAIVEVPGPVPSMARFELPAGTPVFVDHALGQPFGVDPERPEHMAYCGADAIRVTANGGASWITVPVGGLVAASQRTAQPIIPPAGPVCAQALVDPISPTTVYAMFDSLWPAGARATQMAYVTGDLGRSWRQVPPPAGRASTDFAGFRLTAGRVVAIFGVPQIDAPAGTAVLSETVERSLNGGRSWVTASLPCPLVGPCLRLGGAAAPDCSRFAAPNLIEFSADGGRDNRLSSGEAYLDGCSAAELVTYSSGAALRLGGFLRDTAAVSYDGGAVWQELAVPGPPGFDTGSVSYGPIILLTTGGLLTQSATGWFLLQPGTRTWCAVAENAMAALAGPVELIGDRLWSFAPDSGGDAQAPLLQATAPVSLAISALHC